jgi:hypothetical protein
VRLWKGRVFCLEAISKMLTSMASVSELDGNYLRIQVNKNKYRTSSKEYRTMKFPSKFDIPCSIFCGSI